MTGRTDRSEHSGLPLEGVRVIEFSHMVMGPTCGMILADLGAEVIKIEPPGGDKTRVLQGAGTGFYRTFNRNKKSVVLDLHAPAGRAAARELIGQCDVLLQNFRPGLMAQMGLAYADLEKGHPRLIYVSHTGFLPGPYENRLALDEVVQNMAGLTYMTGPPGRPLRAGSSVNDIMGGMFGAVGVLAALRERDRTGRGQEIESALFENCCFLSAQHMQQFLMTGEEPVPFPSKASPWAVYDTFEVADGDQLFVGAVRDKQFLALCELLGRSDLANDPALATNGDRVKARPTLLPRLAESLRTQEIDSLCQRLEAAGCPYARVVRPDQLLHDEHLLASGGLVPMDTPEGPTQAVLLPLSMGGRRLGVRRPLPSAGQDNDEILGALKSAAATYGRTA